MGKEICQRDLAQISDLLKKTLQVEHYAALERMGGLTNHTYHVTLEDGREYVVRIPGEGTETLIIRKNEYISTKLACDLKIDAQMLYFGEDGSKVTEYIPNANTMNAQLLRMPAHITQIAQVLRAVHSCGVDTHVPFEVFDMAQGYESIIQEANVPMFSDYSEQKQIVMDIKSHIDKSIPIQKVPCHNDPLCENWVEGNGKLYLVDWEYAGMNDGMWDVADVSIEASFGAVEDELLLASYLGRTPAELDYQHFIANKIYVDYLWTLWAKARVPYDGQPMEDWAAERYERMKNNIRAFQTIRGENNL